MEIYKEAGVRAAGIPDTEQLAKINRLAKTALEAPQVYCFRVRLCDDQPDRDFERFDTAALPKLAELFLGKTGICDHNWSANAQVARIFDTEVRREPQATSLIAWAYMLRTEKNAPLIADIEGGIRQEVSVGCAMGESRCSVCGAHYGACEHRKGVRYGGETCLAVLSDPVDAYEFSFVAVPAQRAAGVLKGRKGGAKMTLQECVRQYGSPELAGRLKALEAEAAFGRECRAELERETVSLGLVLDFGADEQTLRSAAQALDNGQLRQWKQSMAQKAATLFPPQTQLPKAGDGGEHMDTAFMI